MTLTYDRPVASEPDPDGMTTTDPKRRKFGRTLVKWITSTDHKVIGYMYLISTFVFFLFGGVMAL
jgi:cytochrome c oxidase subunit 1